MRHRLAHRKLGRNSAARKALLKGLVTQLIDKETLVTTIARAKELRKVVEPLVALARVDSVNNRRYAASRIYGELSLKKLFAKVGPAHATRNGGYTRIFKLGFRPGDHARKAMIELVDRAPESADRAPENPQ